MHMKTLTLRNVSQELAEALDKEKSRRGKSLNQTVLELLARALGVGHGKRRNGLAALSGTWTAEELAEFEAATASTEQIDEELWR